jgi:non-heme chloroperoxidase
LSWLPVKLTAVEGGLDFEVLSPAIVGQYPGSEHYYVAADGSELFYRYFEGAGNTVLVLLHGSGTEGRYLKGLAQRLSADAGISVVVPHLRGHGRSTMSTPGDITHMGQLEQDLDILLHHLLGLYPNALMIPGAHRAAQFGWLGAGVKAALCGTFDAQHNWNSLLE